jgi:hypothetical protein
MFIEFLKLFSSSLMLRLHLSTPFWKVRNLNLYIYETLTEAHDRSQLDSVSVLNLQ